MLIWLFTISVLILLYISVYRPVNKTRQYNRALNYKRKEKVFLYKREDSTGIYAIVKNVERIEDNILLTVEIKYPDESTEIFKTTLEVFEDTWK